MKITQPAPSGLATAAQRRYWRSVEELAQAEGFADALHREFPPSASEWLTGFSRRHFLKLMGASVALAGMAGCTRQPTEKIVPYVKQPEELTPGRPLYFATAMTLGGFATGLLVESHEGHPTKIEGNPDHPISLGATNVFHQASLLDLYDPDRSQAVLHRGEISSWTAFLSALHDVLELQQSKRGAGLRILTETITSPTLHAQLEAVLAKFSEARWHQHEPINRDNVYDGARLAFGEVVEAQYEFSKAKVIVALDADFLFAHPAGVRNARQFAESRRMSGERNQMSRLYVVESTPTVTGSNADHRLPLSRRRIEEFTRALAQRVNPTAANQKALELEYDQWLDALAADLKQNRGMSIILAGEAQPPIVHALVHAMNQSLGNVGSTLHYTATAVANPTNQSESLRELVNELQRGTVELLVMLGGNPAFTTPADLQFGEHVSKAQFCVHLSSDVNETSALCQWHVPQNHFLESWSDARAHDGTISIVQPLILPLYAGRSAHEVLDAFLQMPPRSDYEIVRDHWQLQKQWPDFEKGWRHSLNQGVIEKSAFAVKRVSLRSFPIEPPQSGEGFARDEEYEVTFHPDPTIWDGRFANNGWLQELPKPISKLTWDNVAFISPATAHRLELSNGDLIELNLEHRKLRLPIWIMPGQPDDSIAVTLGYGRNQCGRVGKGAGFNSYNFRTSESPWFVSGVKLTKTRQRYPLASTQTHQAIESEERGVFRELTLTEFLKNPEAVRQNNERPSERETLFNPEEYHYEGYRWGMVIDLTACIGCNACILACQSENNIPVVGKDQVARQRAMHWIRVDSYFSGELDRPEMNHQPVPCMHCENAPCELVCPVAATLHDKEGLNLQVYNRCIGTRYCSNNCPYKVRRFNFFQYADYHTPSLKPMRNPNVTVRSRGVMEKCTYCIQRISASRITAKIEDRSIRDGEIQTACQQACPASAIVFGDIGNSQSRVAKLKEHALNYSMLGELNTRPRTTYLAKVRNPNPELAA